MIRVLNDLCFVVKVIVFMLRFVFLKKFCLMVMLICGVCGFGVYVRVMGLRLVVCLREVDNMNKLVKVKRE